MKLKLASILRNHRQQKGYSQNYMAFILGISERTYGRIENGESMPTLAEAPEIARKLDLPLTEFVSEVFGIQAKDFSENRDYDHEIELLKEKIMRLESENKYLKQLIKDRH